MGDKPEHSPNGPSSEFRSPRAVQARGCPRGPGVPRANMGGPAGAGKGQVLQGQWRAGRVDAGVCLTLSGAATERPSRAQQTRCPQRPLG